MNKELLLQAFYQTLAAIFIVFGLFFGLMVAASFAKPVSTKPLIDESYYTLCGSTAPETAILVSEGVGECGEYVKIQNGAQVITGEIAGIMHFEYPRTVRVYTMEGLIYEQKIYQLP